MPKNSAAVIKFVCSCFFISHLRQNHKYRTRIGILRKPEKQSKSEKEEKAAVDSYPQIAAFRTFYAPVKETKNEEHGENRYNVFCERNTAEHEKALESSEIQRKFRGKAEKLGGVFGNDEAPENGYSQKRSRIPDTAHGDAFGGGKASENA